MTRLSKKIIVDFDEMSPSDRKAIGQLALFKVLTAPNWKFNRLVPRQRRKPKKQGGEK